MALTVLDPQTALIVVDLQQGLVGLAPVADVIARSRMLADAFRARGLPIVLVNVVGGAPGRTEQPRRDLGTLPADFAEFVPELGRRPGDIVVTKRTWGAFTATDLERYLRQCGVTQVVVVGVATTAGVESTARHAHELGFNVALAVDAMTDMNADAHHNSVVRIFPRMAETGTTQEIIDLLDARSRSGNRSA